MRQNWENYTLVFNLAETTSAWPPQGGGRAQQELYSAKAPTVEAEHKENPAQGKWQEAQHTGNLDSKKTNSEEPHVAQSQIPENLWLR